MKITLFIAVNLGAITLAISPQAFGASSSMTLRNLEDTNIFLDSSGVALDSGIPDTLNGNGTVAQLGYFSTSTATFDGEWLPIAEFHIGDYYQQTGGDSIPDGKYLVKVTFDGTEIGLPSSDYQMAIRFYEGTDTVTDNYNTVTHSAWKFLTPTTPTPVDRDFDVNDNSDTLTWEDGGANAFKTTITTVPEPSSFALLGLGGIALLFRRRK